MTEPAAEPDLLGAEAGAAAARGGLVRVAAYGAGSALSLVSTALLLRHLGVDDSGRYLTVLSLVALAAGLTDAGLTSIGVREHATGDAGARRALLADLLGLRVALTLVGVAGAVVFALVAGYGGPLVAGTAIAGAGMLLQLTQSALSVGLLARLRLAAAALCDLARQLTSTLAIVVLVLAGAGLVPFFLAGVVGGVATLALTARLVRGDVPLRPSWHAARWRVLLADVGPYAAATAVGAVHFRLAIVLVSLVTGAAQTGYFAAAFRGVEVLIVVPNLVAGAALPVLARAARDDRARLSEAVGRLFATCASLGVATAVVLAVAASPVMRAVAGDDFGPAAAVLRIQGIGLAISFLAAAWSYAALALHLHREVLRAALAALVVNATLVLVLASSHGARGAAVGTTIAEGVLAAGMALAVRAQGVALIPAGFRPGSRYTGQ